MTLFGLGRRRPQADGTPTRAWERHLAGALAHLPDADRLTAHVLTGDDPAAVAALTTPATFSHSHPARIGLVPHQKAKASYAAVQGLWAGAGDVDAAVLRRWVRVLETLDVGVFGWGRRVAPVAGAPWLEPTLTQLVLTTPPGRPLPVTFDDLVRIAEVDGASARDVLTALLTPAGGRDLVDRFDVDDVAARLAGLADALVEHTDVVVAGLTTGAVEPRVRALDVVGGALPGARREPFALALAHATTATSRQVRDRAEALLAGTPGASTALRTVAVDGGVRARTRALELLVRDPAERAWARETAAADRTASVRALVTQWDAAEATAPVEDDTPVPEPLPPIRWAVPRERAQVCVDRLVAELEPRTLPSHRGHVAAHPLGKPDRRARVARDLVAVLVADGPPPLEPVVALNRWQVGSALQSVAREGLVDTVTAVKLAAALDILDGGWRENGASWLLEAVHAHTGEPDLRTLAAMYDAMGLDGVGVVWQAYARASYSVQLGRTWDAADVWPFVAENLDRLLAESLPSQWEVDTLAPYGAFATLPHLPQRLVTHLLALATDTRKTHRRAAQDALAGVPGLAERAAAGLLDGRAAVREATAQWLARLADPAALPAVQQAWAKEKQDVVRGALLGALVAMGEHVETYLDPEATSAAAAKVVAKGLPAALAWCDWDAVPPVRWAASGEAVPREVVQWLCVTAVRRKSAEPDMMLRRYAQLFDPEDRARLALHLLTAWIHADTLPRPREESEADARQYAASWHQWMTAPGSQYAGLSVDQLAAALLPGMLRQPAGSEIAAKGVLAVVAACGGPEVVGPAERYLREWYGQRAAQGRALITMLAWVDHPTATQLVLAIGSRFRTRGLQEEAITQAAALAERKGWTVDELADRTIPTAGFEDDGVMELPYGPRTFVARLLPDLTIEVRDPDGKVVKTLPTPRRTDDEEVAKESRKALTAARKDVKSIARLQQQRLYEAMCTERTWSAEDWQRYLVAHPVVGPAVRRLVWVATDEDGSTQVFRPLDDGTLTDVDDEPVALPPTARVRVAHATLLTPEQSAAWTAHLADYEVAPLFPQLGRDLRSLTEAQRVRQEFDAFEGHVLGSFALRARATRLGWTRGPAEDGGWFLTYLKTFPTLGLGATIEFTGSPLPEENRTVALRTLTFQRRQPDGTSRPVALADVPAVLLSECLHDLAEIAAQGTGFDPDWRSTAL